MPAALSLAKSMRFPARAPRRIRPCAFRFQS
jgi:hypothetical protein